MKTYLTSVEHHRDYLPISGKGVMQSLLQILAGHSVVQVGHLDLCALSERLKGTFRAGAPRGSQQR